MLIFVIFWEELRIVCEILINFTAPNNSYTLINDNHETCPVDFSDGIKK